MEAGGGKIVVGLGFVGRGELGDGLEFENDLAVDDQVCDVFADDLVLVDHSQALLALEGEAAQGQLVFESGLLDGLEKAGAEDAVDFHGRADDYVGEC